MGAVSIVEDIVKRWDETSTQNYNVGPAGPSKECLPPNLEFAFEELIEKQHVAGDLLKRSDLNNSWQAIAQELDQLQERQGGWRQGGWRYCLQ